MPTTLKCGMKFFSWLLAFDHSKCLGLIFVTCVLCLKCTVDSWTTLVLKFMVPLTCWYFPLNRNCSMIRAGCRTVKLGYGGVGSQLFLDFPLCMGGSCPKPWVCSGSSVFLRGPFVRTNSVPLLTFRWVRMKTRTRQCKKPNPRQVALFKMINKFPSQSKS